MCNIQQICSFQVEFDLNSDSLYFNDGQSKVDFILVNEDESKKESQKSFHKKQKV